MKVSEEQSKLDAVKHVSSFSLSFFLFRLNLLLDQEDERLTSSRGSSLNPVAEGVNSVATATGHTPPSSSSPSSSFPAFLALSAA